MFNTNVDGKYELGIALTKIKGIGRRYAKACCVAAHINPAMRAGELTSDQEKTLIKII